MAAKLGRLKSGDRRHRLETARSSYDLDERVPLDARVLDEDFRPTDPATQEILLAGPSGSPGSQDWHAVSGSTGQVRGEFHV